jgi:leader peptidase (prepilin peptidase) / N-methyltransferase
MLMEDHGPAFAEPRDLLADSDSQARRPPRPVRIRRFAVTVQAPTLSFWFWFILVTLFGACVGSFLNVVIYRLPEGRSLVTPPSACPKCGTRLAWYDNVPVLGWFWLRAKCRYCKAPIAFQYPLVESLTAGLFAAVFLAYYIAGMRPGFLEWGLDDTWPVMAVYLVLAGALIAATVIDARFFIIPLGVPWTAAAVAALVLPVAAVAWPAIARAVPITWLPGGKGQYWWVLDTAAPVVEGGMIGAAIGGVIGLAIAIALRNLGVLPLSFPEEPPTGGPDAKGAAAVKPADSKPAKATQAASAAAPPKSKRPWFIGIMIAVAVLLVVFGQTGEAMIAAAILWWGVLLEGTQDDSTDELAEELGPESWAQHENPRLEVLKECLFLALPIAGMVVGRLIMGGATPQAAWLRVLGGVAMGFLVGGGFVWLIRVGGTLAFGKEAMGLGDVHLMAAVGAALGWVDACVIFMLAALLGLAHTVLVMGATQMMKKRATPIPYGPHLCGAAVLMILFRQPIAYFVWLMTGLPI